MDTTETWPRCRQAAAFFEGQLRAFAEANPAIAAMASRFADGAGVDILHLVDHWVLPDTAGVAGDLTALGLVETETTDGDSVWQHPQARLPRVRLDAGRTAPRLALGVESVPHFLEASGLAAGPVQGDEGSRYREALCALPGGELAVVERAGYSGFRPGTLAAAERNALNTAREAFRGRRRNGDEDEAEVVEHARELVASVIDDIGQSRATDEFFAAERAYYLARNRAARWQYERQQRLGLGWANHDHHTYRSSRAGFRALMQLWDGFGFIARERFYAGAEAGWGAQILEHPVSRVVLFCDLDMAPEELDIDYARMDLPPRPTLGTIGLWCALHGSSIGEAGLHHLEAEFDFARAASGFENAEFPVMAPFTDLPMLKQAFTEAEIWAVRPERVHALRRGGLITEEQAARFLAQGAPGSHLEILQRWDGFKGFNKTGVSAIIRDTDARKS